MNACCIKLYQIKTILTYYKTTWIDYNNGLTIGIENISISMG